MTEERTDNERRRDPEAMKLLGKLEERLYSRNPSAARKAAFRLSWMQEDGLDILEEALRGAGSKRTKSAATYGMRKMRGRMKKKALDVLRSGLTDKDEKVRDVCENALSLVGELPEGKSKKRKAKKGGRFGISEVPPKRGRGRQVRGRPNHNSRRR